MANPMLIKAEGSVLTLQRVFDAPRELVFRAFTEAEHLKHWWGPRGWEVTECQVDFREGGSWFYCFKCMDKEQGDFYGMESWGKAIYGEIDAPANYAYVDYFSDAEGTINEEMPAAKSTMIFHEQEGGKTRVVCHSSYASEEALQQVIAMGMEQGITETWDRLGEHLQAVQS